VDKISKLKSLFLPDVEMTDWQHYVLDVFTPVSNVIFFCTNFLFNLNVTEVLVIFCLLLHELLGIIIVDGRNCNCRLVGQLNGGLRRHRCSSE